MLNYDRFETWEPSFSKVISEHVDHETLRELVSTEFEFFEDRGDFISQAAGIEEISSAIRDWITRNDFCVFHGSRLLPDEFSLINAVGLKPLVAYHREERLRKLLSGHKNWRSHEGDLARVIEEVGPGNKNGKREGQIHFSLSWSGLVNGFDHYLAYGSEFDQRVSQVLFGDDSGLEFLRSDTSPYVVHVRMSGKDLVAGAHPYFTYDDVIRQGEVPGLGSTFLNAWAFKKAVPDYDLSKLRTDSCMMLKRPVSPEDVVYLEKLD